MDEFVKKAFEDSMDKMEDDEFKAYKEEIADKCEIILQSIGMAIGLGNMEIMSKVILLNGIQETFGEFMHRVFVISFHRGYERGRRSL